MPKTLINCPMLVSGCADRDSYDTQLLYFTCSSLSRDDKRIFLLSDRNGSPNVWVRALYRRRADVDRQQKRHLKKLCIL